MRRLAPIFAFALLLLAGAPAFAWEETGHRLTAIVAAEAFPPEIPAFLRTPEAIRSLGELTREPDRSKGSGQPHDADLDPGHFVDLDDAGQILGGPRLDALPPNRAAHEQALQAAKTDSWKAGWLPYSIAEGFEQLAKDFGYWRVDVVGEKSGRTPEERTWFAADRKLRELIILRDLGYWSHFVGDGSQPMHVSIHFNGWGDFPNPNGFTRERIHSPFEGEFVRAHVDAAAVRAAMRPYRPCGCTPLMAAGRYLQETAAQIEPLYRLWGQGAFQGPSAPQGTAFVVDRLAAGASQLRDRVVDAWRASGTMLVGYPPVNVKSVEDTGVVPFDQIYGRG